MNAVESTIAALERDALERVLLRREEGVVAVEERPAGAGAARVVVAREPGRVAAQLHGDAGLEGLEHERPGADHRQVALRLIALRDGLAGDDERVPAGEKVQERRDGRVQADAQRARRRRRRCCR